MTARRGDGDSTEKQAGPREATRSSLPCSRAVRASLGCTAATSPSPWVQRVCRGATGTPARQSQPGPEHPTCGMAAPCPPAGQRAPIPPARPEPGAAEQGAGGCRRRWLGHTMTHRQGHLLHQWLPAPPTAGRQPGLPGVRGCRHPSAPRHPPPHPLPGPSSAAGTGGRANHHPPKPPQRPPPRCRVIGLPAPRTGVEHGVGAEPVGHPLPTAPRLSLPVLGDPSPRHPGGALEGAAQPCRAVGAPSLPGSERCPRLGSGLARAGRGIGILGATERNQFCPFPLRLCFFSFFCFLFSFGTPRARSQLLPPPRCAPPIPVPGPGGRGGSCSRHAAVTRRSLLLWPGPSAPCPCPAVRLSCRPCPGRLLRARGRGLRRPRSGRSS